MNKPDLVTTGAEGRRVAWRVAGHGRSLLLLHGGYGSWNHWAANIAGLADSARLLVPDMPGFGQSDSPDDLQSLDSIADRLIDGLNSLIGAAETIDVAAFSFGGSVAAAIGFACPGRIGHLILVGTSGLRAPRPPSIVLESWRDAPDERMQREIHRRNLQCFMFADSAVADDEAVDFQRINTLNARVKSRPLSRLGHLHDYLAQHQGLIDGVWGDHDATSMGYLAERRAILQAVDEGSTLEEIVGAGHWVMREEPLKTNFAIRRFLERSSH